MSCSIGDLSLMNSYQLFGVMCCILVTIMNLFNAYVKTIILLVLKTVCFHGILFSVLFDLVTQSLFWLVF